MNFSAARKKRLEKKESEEEEIRRKNVIGKKSGKEEEGIGEEEGSLETDAAEEKGNEFSSKDGEEESFFSSAEKTGVEEDEKKEQKEIDKEKEKTFSIPLSASCVESVMSPLSLTQSTVPASLSLSLAFSLPAVPSDDRVNRLASVGSKFRVAETSPKRESRPEKEISPALDRKEEQKELCHSKSERVLDSKSRGSEVKTPRSRDARLLSKNTILTKSRRSVQSITKRGDREKTDDPAQETPTKEKDSVDRSNCRVMGSGQKIRDSDSVVMWFESGFHVTIREGEKIYPCICVGVVNKSWDNISKGESLSLFFSHSASEIAMSLSHHQHTIYSSIHPREIFMWTHTKRKERDCPSMFALVAHFNRLASWAVHSVVTRIKKRERVEVLSKIVEASRCCLEMNNFLAVQAFVSAYHHSAIVRMKKTLSEIGGLTREMDHISDVMSHLSNFSVYRAKLTGAKPPRIPYVGLESLYLPPCLLLSCSWLI